MRRVMPALGALLVAGLALAQPAPPASVSLEPPPGALLAPGSAPSLAFFTTGDVIGYLDPCG